MQQVSWNLDNFKFEAGFAPKPLNYKSTSLATRPWTEKTSCYGIRSTRLGEISRMT
jgi:hypothetical protein